MPRLAPLIRTLLVAVLSGAALAAAWPAPVRPERLRPVVPARAVLRVAADKGQVYVMSGGRVRAYDASLRHQRWSAPLRSFGTLAVGGGLVVADDGFTNLHAYDARSGKLVWTVAAPRPLSGVSTGPGSTPFQELRVTHGVVIGVTYDDIRAWDARTGRPRWQVQAVDPNRLLSGSGKVTSYNARTGIDGYMRGVDTATGKRVWSHRELGLATLQQGELIFTTNASPAGKGVSVVQVRTGRSVTVRYAFPAFENAQHAIYTQLYLHDAQVCAEGIVNGVQRVQCLPRTAGRYLGGDRRLLAALRPSGQASSSVWEQQTRRVLFAVDGTWLLGGSGPVRLKLPWARMPRPCSVGGSFAEAGPLAVFAAFGPGRIAVVDQRSGRMVRLVRALGDVKAAWMVAGRLVVLTDQAVFSVTVPGVQTRT